ncbi:MAG TPA: very short patch repair endonuclease [Methylibium sp.]|uniref:very short patch repair endonuclease n=1 Tax=Methylibium sp. TaxID=2067992 RepID=UPI002DBD372B|nr:very short patch repair endonuclease [Methylibium sp.]HEU4460858.1 very short patch repair endonuclease [Methylibium sp.]
MVDVVSPARRSQMMSGIKGKDSLPERLVRKALFAMGYRFRLHRRDLPGTPDLVMPRRKIALFVHGCFWHAHRGCKYAKTPSTRPEFWSAKLQSNVARDQRAVEKLTEMGWRVLCVWECSIRDREAAAGLSAALRLWIESDAKLGEIGGPSTNQAMVGRRALTVSVERS